MRASVPRSNRRRTSTACVTASLAGHGRRAADRGRAQPRARRYPHGRETLGHLSASYVADAIRAAAPRFGAMPGDDKVKRIAVRT